MQDNIFKMHQTRLSGLSASATGEVTSSPIDLNKGDRGEIEVAWGTMAGAQTIEIDGSNDNSSWTAIKNDAGATLALAVSTGSASKYTKIELAVPNYRYIRVRVPRANAAQILCITGRVYNVRVEPVPGDDVPVRYIHAYPPSLLPNGKRVQTSL